MERIPKRITKFYPGVYVLEALRLGREWKITNEAYDYKKLEKLSRYILLKQMYKEDAPILDYNFTFIEYIAHDKISMRCVKIVIARAIKAEDYLKSVRIGVVVFPREHQYMRECERITFDEYTMDSSWTLDKEIRKIAELTKLAFIDDNP